MFFPIIGAAPRGKLGLLYVVTLLAISFWLLFFVVLPTINTAVRYPNISDKLLQSVDSVFYTSTLFTIIGGIIFVIGAGILSLTIYYNREEIKECIKIIFNEMGIK